MVALDREDGCPRWVHAVDGVVASAILHGGTGAEAVLYFGLRGTGIASIRAATGKPLWTVAPGDNPVPVYSGTPLLSAGTLFVPTSSLEIGLALNPLYGCCTTSGGLSALDAETGETLWHLRTIAEPARVTDRRWLFIEMHGPSGAPVWGPPTLDEGSGTVFFGTGQNYSHPTTDTSDAIFAVDRNTGEIRWLRQFTANDAYNLACDIGGPNCPEPMGPDLDFGAPPVLATLPDGQRLLLAGQKSGVVHAMDPADGTLRWQRRVGRGGALGGIHWGMAVDEGRGLVFVPISDIYVGDALTGEGESGAGVHALDMATGEVVWSYGRKPRCPDRSCSSGVSAAVSAAEGVVFALSLDGFIEALDADTGDRLWVFDSWRTFAAVNGADGGTHNRAAEGGAFDAHGVMLADDLLIVSSGYGSFGQRPGNALLVFELAEAPE